MAEGSGARDGPPIEVAMEELAQRLNRKLTFEDAVSKLTDIVENEYALASARAKEKMFGLVCKVEKLLRNRYTVKGFWMAGRRLFQIMEAVTESPSEKQQARLFAQKAQEFLGESEAMEDRQAGGPSTSTSSSSSSVVCSRAEPFLFEGQLSQPEPQPQAPPVLASLSAMGGGELESETLIAALAWFVAENTPPSDAAFSIGEQSGGGASQEDAAVGNQERNTVVDGSANHRQGNEGLAARLRERGTTNEGQSDGMVVDQALECSGLVSGEELELRDAEGGEGGTSVMNEPREGHDRAEDGDSDVYRLNSQEGELGRRASLVLGLSAERMEDGQELHMGVNMGRDGGRESPQGPGREERGGGGGGGGGELMAADEVGNGNIDNSSGEGDRRSQQVEGTNSSPMQTSGSEERDAVREQYRRLFLRRTHDNNEGSNVLGDNDFGPGYIPSLLRLLREGLMRVSSEDIEEVLRQTIIEAEAMESGPPPASKEEVEKLPVLELTEKTRKNLAEPECPVCREDFAVGDSVRYMPCKHYFHPACLQPWLDKHNSCPICRFEMRTDDEDYERRKEREKQAQEERRGVENALPEAEFMYM